MFVLLGEQLFSGNRTRASSLAVGMLVVS